MIDFNYPLFFSYPLLIYEYSIKFSNILVILSWLLFSPSLALFSSNLSFIFLLTSSLFYLIISSILVFKLSIILLSGLIFFNNLIHYYIPSYSKEFSNLIALFNTNYSALLKALFLFILYKYLAFKYYEIASPN